MGAGERSRRFGEDLYEEPYAPARHDVEYQRREACARS